MSQLQIKTTTQFKKDYKQAIKPDWSLIYRIVEDNILVLTLFRTGSHSDLFRN